MTVELPTNIVAASTKSPEMLILFSAPKAGKTTLVSQLENNLLIDLEGGSNFVSAMKIKAGTYQELHEICEKIKEQGKPYKYITLDTATALEDLCLPLALKLYQKTPMGASYKGEILNLPNGAGYLYLRNAFQLMIDKVGECADRIILLGHVKDKTIEKGGKEIVARELALTGKLASITCAHADAIGFIYREGNKCMVTFETDNQLICGARPAHLRNKNFVISEENDKGEIVTHWNKIFID